MASTVDPYAGMEIPDFLKRPLPQQDEKRTADKSTTAPVNRRTIPEAAPDGPNDPQP